MQLHDYPQGSPEWLKHRAQHFNASDAPAMLGCSPYKTRAQLLREIHTGVVPDVDPATLRLFDAGHRAEALARPLAEGIIGEELYPVTGSVGRLSASFDGLTMDEQQGLEHKSLNAELRAAFNIIEAADYTSESCRVLPIHHRVQMEQQLLVSGAERILFMASEWDDDGALVEERHCWYYPDIGLRQQIIDGWRQFEADLAAYVLPEAAAPAPVGRAPETLPALRIEIKGAVTASNLAEFKATALGAIRSVNRDLRTDQDFADADKAVKWCGEVESRLKAAKEHALSQTADIDALFRALDEIAAEAGAVRLDLDKLVTRRKTEVKEEAVKRARDALQVHLDVIHAEIAPHRIDYAVQWGEVIRGLKSMASVEDKLGAALAQAKIECDAKARVVRANLTQFDDMGGGDHKSLFPDLSGLVHKAHDDFIAVVHNRIAAHQLAEEAKARAKAEAAARAAEAARLAEEAAARAKAEAAAVVRAPTTAPAAPAAPTADQADALTAGDINRPLLTVGDINRMLAPIQISAPGMAEFGLQPARIQGAAKLYREEDFNRLLHALAKHIDSLTHVPA